MKRTALITGASSGIGRDLAYLFAQDDIDLVLVARSGDKLREIANALHGKHGVNVQVIVADLADPAAPQQVFDAVQGDVDMLVNNAGYGLGGPFAETDLRKELDMIQVNIAAVTHLTKLFLRPMVARKWGRILNIASTAAFQPGPLMSVYYATKAYVLSFSEAIAEELAGSGVTVTALCPGPTHTGFAAAAEVSNARLFKLARPMTSDEVARIGYDAMNKGRRMVVAGVKNKVLAQAVRISPRRVTTRIARALQERR